MSPISEHLSVVAAAMSSDPREAARLSRQLGFRGVLFDAFSNALNIPDLSDSGRREFGRVLAAHDQTLVGLRLDLGTRGLGPGADIDRSVQQLDSAMEAAASLEAPLICVDLGPLPLPTAAPKPPPAISSEQAGLILIPKARLLGTTVLLVWRPPKLVD